MALKTRAITVKRKEGKKKEKETDLFYRRPKSFLSAIIASFTAFLFSNSTPP